MGAIRSDVICKLSSYLQWQIHNDLRNIYKSLLLSSHFLAYYIIVWRGLFRLVTTTTVLTVLSYLYVYEILANHNQTNTLIQREILVKSRQPKTLTIWKKKNFYFLLQMVSLKTSVSIVPQLWITLYIIKCFCKYRFHDPFLLKVWFSTHKTTIWGNYCVCNYWQQSSH